MIILPKFQVSPPGNVTYDDLVEAAYAGMTLVELAKHHNTDVGDLSKYINKVWPRYFKIAKAARRYYRALVNWDSILSRVKLGKVHPRFIPKSVRHFVYDVLPTYQWSDNPDSMMKTIKRRRPAAAVDRRLLALSLERPYVEKLIDRENEPSKAHRIQIHLGIHNSEALDLLIGVPLERYEKRKAQKYLARMVAKWRLVNDASVVNAKRRYWEERGRHIKIKDKSEPGDGR